MFPPFCSPNRFQSRSSQLQKSTSSCLITTFRTKKRRLPVRTRSKTFSKSSLPNRLLRLPKPKKYQLFHQLPQLKIEHLRTKEHLANLTFQRTRNKKKSNLKRTTSNVRKEISSTAPTRTENTTLKTCALPATTEEEGPRRLGLALITTNSTIQKGFVKTATSHSITRNVRRSR